MNLWLFGEALKKMTEHKKFKKECLKEIKHQGNDKKLKKLSKDWMIQANKYKYSYHFEWLGMPIIQHPQDIIGLQQLLWNLQPDLVIETGIARGGSIIFTASILELISKCGGNQNSKVLGIDIDIRKKNKQAIKKHPMHKRIKMIEGSSTSVEVFNQVKKFTNNFKKILICLDSNHTHDHVLKELKLYAPLVSKGSYCIVYDTIIEDFPNNPNRPWGKSNNPKTAILEYLKYLKNNKKKNKVKFIIDKKIQDQLLITAAADGFLQRQ